MKKPLNIHSKLLNKSEIARRLNMLERTFKDKLTGRGTAKQFTEVELNKISDIIKNDLNL